jgi:hypothetical protein
VADHGSALPLPESLGLDDLQVPWARSTTLMSESAPSEDPFAGWDDFGAMERQISDDFSRPSWGQTDSTSDLKIPDAKPDLKGTDALPDLKGTEGGPRLSTHGEVVSKGSAGHPTECVPCAFYCFRKAGCTNDVDCQYCHQMHHSKSKERKADWKQKAMENRQKRRLAASARSADERSRMKAALSVVVLPDDTDLQ